MNIWDFYEARVQTSGPMRRDTVLRRTKRTLHTKLPDSLSYHCVTIDGLHQDVAILNSDNLDEKTIYSLAKNESKRIRGGELVDWMDNYWLIVECDANSEIYTKAKMKQCNYLLRWVDSGGNLHEQWCIIEDGTKYLTGEYEDRNFVVTRGDSRISMTIARNEDTVKFGREDRFLIDDPDTQEKLAYLLTKPLKVGEVYNGAGVYSFVLQEVVSTEDDNYELGVADYYKFFPKEQTDEDDNTNDDAPSLIDPHNKTSDGRQVWL